MREEEDSHATTGRAGGPRPPCFPMHTRAGPAEAGHHRPTGTGRIHHDAAQKEPAVGFCSRQKSHRIQDLRIERIGSLKRSENSTHDCTRRIGESILGKPDGGSQPGVGLGGKGRCGNEDRGDRRTDAKTQRREVAGSPTPLRRSVVPSFRRPHAAFLARCASCMIRSMRTARSSASVVSFRRRSARRAAAMAASTRGIDQPSASRLQRSEAPR